MSKLCFPLILASALLSLTSCSKQSADDIIVSQRQNMQPAKTAQEWLDRLQLDLTTGDVTTNKHATLYTELPPQDQWPAIITKLNEVTKDADSYSAFIKNDNRRFQHSSAYQERLKLQLFSILLAQDETNAEPTMRSLLKDEAQMPLYNYGEILGHLLLISKDQENSIKWFNDKMTNLGDPHHSHSSADKPAWAQALAKNDIVKGIEQLKNAIQNADNDDQAELISKLATIAHLLHKPDLGEQAMTMHEANIIARKKNSNYFHTYSDQDALDYLLHHKQYQRLLDLCTKVQNTKPSQKQHIILPSDHDSLLHYRLTALHKLGKTDQFEEEINTLHKKHQADPRQFFQTLHGQAADNPSIGSLYIDLLTKQNTPESKTKAYQISSHLLARNQGTDVYYKHVIALRPQAAATLIASIHTYDPFEERPLIWQAEMALADGKINLADKLIQQAIALDPSDGDHGKFIRMHCYDVFARILEKQGNTEKANFLHQVVISIRQGEAADDYLHAGLIQEATDRYKKALGHFNDAYCLQSRLAKTLMEAGKFQEAIPHFKKAFELMPVSFGPKESHCFGCEGLFDDERVRNLALPTLQAFLEKEPENPRTPYLLGLLFEEMNKQPEAITAYQKAIQLDPHYYNAASRLQKLITKDPTRFNQSQALNKQLFQIAAYHRKADYMPSPHLFKTYWKQAQNFPPSPLQLSPLTDLGFTKTKLSDQQYKDVPYNRSYSSSFSRYDSDAPLDGWSARELLLKNNFINDILD
ncbi:MAG: tetratricopeptide repeat protein [Akkermansiaceae bacterium]